jgi:hypothetical protein
MLTQLVTGADASEAAGANAEEPLATGSNHVGN